MINIEHLAQINMTFILKGMKELIVWREFIDWTLLSKLEMAFPG